MQPVRAPPRRRARARVRDGLPCRGDPGRRHQRPRVRGVPGDQQGAGPGAAAGEGDQARCVLQGRARRHARPAGGAQARRRPVRVGDARQAGPAIGHVRASRSRHLPGRRAAVLRRPAPGTVGLAGEPVHLDQVGRGRRIRRAGPAGRYRIPELGKQRRPMGSSGAGTGLPRGHRRAARGRPEAPGAVLPAFHPAPLAELARARRGDPRRVRGGRGGVPAHRAGGERVPGGRYSAGQGCRSRWRPPSTPHTCSGRPKAATCGRARCSRRTLPCRPCWPARRRCCRC